MNRQFVLPAAALLIVAGFGSLIAVTHEDTTTTSTSTTTSTTIPYERAQPDWTVVSRSSRGVMVDYRNLRVGSATFRVLRLRARTTFLDWHVGSTDPPGAVSKVPKIAGPSIDWPIEGPAGIIAVFNGGFKQKANAGGAVVDGVTLSALVKGDMTLAINALGNWTMGVWGAKGFPAPGFDAVTYRQNLAPLVQDGRIGPSAAVANWRAWGSPLNNNPLTPRTGLGVDSSGNLIFVATMEPVQVIQVAQALVGAGAVQGMELDMNPFWPILGASSAPLHGPGPFDLQLVGSQHDATIYETGWERDFFVAMAEPNSWSCKWVSRTRPGPLVSIVRRGTDCTSTPTSTTSTSTTSTVEPPTTSGTEVASLSHGIYGSN